MYELKPAFEFKNVTPVELILSKIFKSVTDLKLQNIL